MTFSQMIQDGLTALNISCTANQLALLERYAVNMSEEGVRRGLTALKNPALLIRELIVDAVGAVPLLQQASTIADLGSGGGTPGLPLAVMLPNASLLLVESNQRKAAWIAEQIEALSLQDRVSVSTTRIEELGRHPEHRQHYDFVVAKALAALPALTELSLPLLKVGGSLCAYKGSKFAQEIDAAARAFQELRGRVERIHHYSLEGMDRVIVQVTKQQPTPKAYPRRNGTPQHSPL